MKKLLLLVALTVVLVSAGCAADGTPTAKLEGGSVNSPISSPKAGDDMFFRIDIARAGDPIGIDFRGTASQGTLRAQLEDPEGKVIWSEAGTGSSFFFNKTIETTQAGKYQLGLVWDGPVQAQYSLVWKPYAVQPPVISPLVLLPGLGMLLVGLGFAGYALLKRLGWKYLLLGGLFWVVTVALKFAWAIPLNGGIYQALSAALGAPGLLLFDLYVGALTGIFEVGVTYLVLRYTRLGRVSWSRALAFGIGFGSVEAIVLGISPLASGLVALFAPNTLPFGALESLGAAANPLLGLAPIWERFFTVWVHILSNVLILYAVAVRQPRWFWLAFLYKTGIDTVAAYAQVSGMLVSGGGAVILNMWLIEAVVALFGIVGMIGTRWIGSRYPGQAGIAAPAGVQPLAENPA